MKKIKPTKNINNSEQVLNLNDLLVQLANPDLTLKDGIHLKAISLLISQPNDSNNHINDEADFLKKDTHEIFTSNRISDNDRRYSFLSANPSQQITFTSSDQLDAWKASLSDVSTSPENRSEIDLRTFTNNSSNTSHIPFQSGWMGYLPYPSSNNVIIAEFNYYPWTLCLDHHTHEFHLLGQPDEAARNAFAWLLESKANKTSTESIPFQTKNFKAEQFKASPFKASPFKASPFKASPFKAQWSKTDYQKAFLKVQNYLLAGDSYQVNLTQPFISNHYSGSPTNILLPLFNALKPSFGCYFQGRDCELVSVSPERFISIDNDGKLEAKPIKGTIKRSNEPVLDQKLIDELVNSGKNQAENLMIVDLLRNDLSMSAIPGSVKVDKLFELESHPNVHHLVSTISAQLKPSTPAIDAIFSAFPGGSITGAPKKRAMEIIEELEAQPRSLYCGSFGYFSDTGHCDFNILIRSLEFRNDSITCWGGGGITIESDCDDEYEESITKIRRIMDVVEALG